MPGLDPGIHLFKQSKTLDCRVKPGNDDLYYFASDDAPLRWMSHGNRRGGAYIQAMPAKLSIRIVKPNRPPPLLVCRNA